MLRLIVLSTSLKSHFGHNSMTKRLTSTAASAATAQANSKPINLLAGWPNPKLLPPESLRVAANRVCTDESISTPALGYGPDEGYGPLRESIAAWLTEFYSRTSAPVVAGEICITGGASQNLACVLQTFSDPIYTRNIWLVSPTYFHACKIFDDAGFAGRLRAVPEDDEGIDLKYLAKAIHASEEKALKDGNTEPKLKSPRPWRKYFKHIIYAVPTFSNPSGRLMSLERREGLVRLARQYDALIVTDDVYDMLQWPVPPVTSDTNPTDTRGRSLTHACLPRLVDVDATLDGGPDTAFGNAMSNGTFSKIVAPGCRTGWAQGTAKFAYGLSQTGSSKSGGAPSQFTSTFIHQLLTTSVLQTHIHQTLQPAYSRRYHAMLTAIHQYLLPLGCKLISRPAETPNTSPNTNSSPPLTIGGGYFHYITLPPQLSRQNTNGKENNDTVAERITKLAYTRENLIVMAGPMFRVDGDVSEIENMRYEADIRLSFAWAEEEEIAIGVERLARVIERELQST